MLINLLVFFGVLIVTGVILISLTPKHVIEAQRETVFYVNKPYQEVAKSLVTNKVMECILDANGATLLQQTWVDRKFGIQRPLNPKLRTWQFAGTANAQVLVRNPDVGQIPVSLIQDIDANQDRILVRTRLAQPLAVGITDLEQYIFIENQGDQTKVTFRLYMKLHRRVPAFARDYANKRVQQAADNQVAVFEPVFVRCVNQPPKGILSLIPQLNNVQNQVPDQSQQRMPFLRRNPRIHIEF